MLTESKINKETLPKHKLEQYGFEANMIRYWRKNPVQACRDLLDIELLDFQAYTLQYSWNTGSNVWCMGRNSGKTFLGAIFIMLKQLLYEDQQIWIIAPQGKQSKQVFEQIEKIAMNNIMSLDNKNCIYIEELVKYNNSTGFKHDPVSHSAKTESGSKVGTLNGKIDNNRSARSTLIFFDEVAFADDELVSVSSAFGTTNTDFVTSTDKLFDSHIFHKKVPQQFVYASSASDKTHVFYRKYREHAKEMFLGNPNYFVIDINADIPMNPTMKGEPYNPLLSKSTVEEAVKTNPMKAHREYYNKFDEDGGEDQVIKAHMITRNETFYLPELTPSPGSKWAVAVDPARSYDNSIMSIMKIMYDPERGYYGQIKNMVHFLDLESITGKQMITTEQVQIFRETMLLYNNKGAEYENVFGLIDAGSGGGGNTVWADNIIYDWKDERGIEHRGFIDKEYTQHAELEKKFPNAYNCIDLVSPNKFRTQMIDELIHLIELGLIEFPFRYDGSGVVQFEDEKGILQTKRLTLEEEKALANIEIAKEEMKIIYRYSQSPTNYKYDIRKDLRRTMHDDRFYTMALLAHHLYKLRAEDDIKKLGSVRKDDYDFVLT